MVIPSKNKSKKIRIFFESLNFTSLKRYNIPISRLIDPENNKLHNYGTIEIKVNQPGKNPSYKILNNEIEKENVINSAKELYPNICNAYKDKIANDKLKFFFAITTVGQIRKKSSFDYWSKLYGDGIDGQTGYGILINSKKNGQNLQTHISLSEISDLPLNFDITYQSEWKKGEEDRPYGLYIGNSELNKYFFYTTISEKSGIEGTSDGSNSVSEISNQNAFSAG
jgi:hypothetical protein